MVKGLLEILGINKNLKLDEPAQEPQAQENKTSAYFGMKPKGTSGTQIYSGYLYEEYLAALRTRTRADIFDKMRRSDSQVMSLTAAVKNPIKGANWEIRPGDDSEEAKQDAELMEHILFNGMEEPFEKFKNEALTLIDFGYSLFEPVYSVVLDHPKFGTYNGIKCLAFRSQRTIDRWNICNIEKNLKSVTQVVNGDLDVYIDIPADELLHFSINQEGQNYEGISLLRPCYGNWMRKNEYLKLNAVGIEKFAVPTPLVEIPDGKQGTEAVDKMQAALEVYTQHQANYLMYPNGWKIDLRSNTYDPQKVEVSIDNEDARMARGFLANFLNLGQGGSGGAYALSNDLSDFFLSGIEYIAGEITSKINRCLIPAVIQMNKGRRAVYPKLVVSGISDKAGKELADIISTFSDKKIITPDNVLERHVRKLYKLPEMSDEGKREVNPVSSFQPQPQLRENKLRNRIIAAELRSRGQK